MPTPQKPGGPLSSQFAHDPEMAELVEMFVSELPARMEALGTAWSGKNIADLTRMAHQLKGASAGYGFPTIGEAAGTLEHGLKALNATAAQNAVESLAREYRALVDLCARACQKP